MTRDLDTHVESVYAAEGTMFHTLCELRGAARFLLDRDLAELNQDFLEWELEVKDEWREEQLAYSDKWLEFLSGLMDEAGPEATLLLEQRVDTGIPGCWGTGDAMIMSPGHVHIIDIKYGMGDRVSALNNSQLRLYGLGALEMSEDPLKVHDVTMTIWQPRMNNISSETLTRRELLRWKRNIKPRAELALGEDAPFGPSEEACRWCPIAGDCGPRTRWMLNQDYGDPDHLSDEEMAEAYSRIKALKKWMSDIEDAALKRAYEEGGSVPGYKVVRSGGRRSITNDDDAIDRLRILGYDLDDIMVRKAASLGKLDKLVGGPERLQEVLGDLLVKSEGRLSLAPESDPRPPADALHSAKMDFADIVEGDA